MSSTNENIKITSNAGVGDIISRSWHFYRNNYKQALIYSVVANCIINISLIQFMIPSTYVSNTDLFIKSYFCFCISGSIFFMFAYYIELVLGFGVIKGFYNKIARKNSSLSTSFEFIKINFGSIVKLSGIIILEISLFLIVDIILMVIITIPAMIILTIAGKSQTNIIVLFNVAFYVFIFIATIQYLVFGLQSVIYVFEECSIVEALEKSYKLLRKNFVKAMVFFLLLDLLWCVLTLMLSFPCVIYQYYQQAVNGLGITKDSTILELIIINLYNFVVNTFLWPFIMSSLTIFYYSLKVDNEGYDLQQSLSNTE